MHSPNPNHDAVALHAALPSALCLGNVDLALGRRVHVHAARLEFLAAPGLALVGELVLQALAVVVHVAGLVEPALLAELAHAARLREGHVVLVEELGLHLALAEALGLHLALEGDGSGVVAGGLGLLQAKVGEVDGAHVRDEFLLLGGERALRAGAAVEVLQAGGVLHLRREQVVRQHEDVCGEARAHERLRRRRRLAVVQRLAAGAVRLPAAADAVLVGGGRAAAALLLQLRRPRLGAKASHHRHGRARGVRVKARVRVGVRGQIRGTVRARVRVRVRA
mmetsp:Transcript_27565/g.87267  ORF Transcript_27565/g.87267 Transcript_27565/m.87267 type:complete len:280 (-) Transcript_27565:41-880(-)